MKTITISLLAVALIGTSCTSSTREPAVTGGQYLKLSANPKLTAKKFQLTCKVIDENGATSAFVLPTAMSGMPVKAKRLKDFVYPVAFDLPAVAGNTHGDSFPITPTTPTSFATRQVGDEINLTVVQRGAFIEVSGRFITTSADVASSRAAGEAYSPITTDDGKVVLTENRVPLPEFTQIDSAVRICGMPEIEHSIYLKAQKKQLLITCHPFN